MVASERHSDPQHVWEERVAAILRDIIECHDGSFTPSGIKHHLMGRGRNHERMYEKLNKRLEKGKLRDFVDNHPEFTWQRHGKNGMLISLAPQPCSNEGSSALQ